MKELIYKRSENTTVMANFKQQLVQWHNLLQYTVYYVSNITIYNQYTIKEVLKYLNMLNCFEEVYKLTLQRYDSLAFVALSL